MEGPVLSEHHDSHNRKVQGTRLLLTVDAEASMAGLRPLPPEAMVYGRVGGGTYGIERIMDCCERRGFRATFFASTLEALHYGEGHVEAICSAALGRGHDVQLHVHPIWLGEAFARGRKRLSAYSDDEQLTAIGEAARLFERVRGARPLAHRAGGLRANQHTLRALTALGIALDSSLAPGFHPYDLGEGVVAPNVPRRIEGIAEVPVTTFSQMRFGPWASRRNFDLNADSLAELCHVVDRAAAEGVAAVTLLMHSFSFIRRNADGTAFAPAEDELLKFERLLDHVAGRQDVAVTTFCELAAQLECEPALLDGADFAPTTGFVRTYRRSWERFGAGWKNKALALGLPAAAVGLAALAIGILRWLTS